ncbi:MAG TPA: hypothetical protein VLA72_16525 [Anaerolineales bacterium]|nr:hypothetical protein [Anaerolineales bacterium]
MTKLEERYKTWIEASEKAFLEGDVDARVALWAEDCTRTVIDAFGEHRTIQGQEAIRKAAEGAAAGTLNRIVLKNELLSATDEKGIGNAEIRWTDTDGKEWACNYIYLITLDENNRCVSYTEWNVVNAKEK